MHFPPLSCLAGAVVGPAARSALLALSASVAAPVAATPERAAGGSGGGRGAYDGDGAAVKDLAAGLVGVHMALHPAEVSPTQVRVWAFLEETGGWGGGGANSTPVASLCSRCLRALLRETGGAAACCASLPRRGVASSAEPSLDFSSRRGEDLSRWIRASGPRVPEGQGTVRSRVVDHHGWLLPPSSRQLRGKRYNGVV